MHRVIFLLPLAYHLASGLAVPDGVLHPNSSTVTTMAHHSEAGKEGKEAKKLVQENQSSGLNHNTRMFLIIFGVIVGFMCLSVALLFTHALAKKRCVGSGKKKRGGRMTLSRLPRDRRGSTDSDIWGLNNSRQGLGAAIVQEKGSGSLREGVIPPAGRVYQEVPTEEEAGSRYTSYTYHSPQYSGDNPRALEERYEGRSNKRDSWGSVSSESEHGEPAMPVNVI